MDGKFGFSNERLDVIMRKICRWYDVEVLYAVPGIRERRFTGAACQYYAVERAVGGIKYHDKSTILLEGWNDNH